MTETFEYRTYGKGELANLYSPHISSGAACRKLMGWIRFHPTLMDALTAVGFTERSRTFTPIQVKLIIDALGEP